MTPFLKQVAAHYLAAPDIQKRCFIFPNRRSLVFFKKYLGEALQGSAPILVPPLYTINDFFYELAHARTTDRLRLLVALYHCYKALNDKAEPLDEFLFWGEVLLADFDDIDKYLVDARALMQNVGDFKAIQDQFEYLSESQKEAIGHFLSHFRDASGGWKLNPEADDVKARFLRLWNLLFPLYEAFNKKLEVDGMSYEGKVYRALATRLKEGESVADILAGAFPEVKGYVFVGLNALNECERLVLSRMRDARVAEFSWDYVSPQIQDKANKSSFFMRRNMVDYPQAFPVEGGTGRPEVTVISVPSGVGQAKLAPWILKQVGGDPVETAFVLPDEGLLLPLLNSIPESYDNVNVTMGYPMTGSAVFALLTNLGQMQLRLRHTSAGWFFYHREVREVLSSGLLKSLFTEEEKAAVSQIKADAKYYIPLQDLQAGSLMTLLFKPVVDTSSEVNVAQNHAVETYFSELLAHLGSALSGREDYLELDFVARCHKQLNILQEMDLEVLPATHIRLLERLLQGISVPFRGEPLKGLQVMGPLETRALDFRNLIVLSANEGMFPRRSVSASFIPPELRRGFGLPTYEYQDAVWAYYFYRMIQRPQKVWLVYDNRTEGIRNGEESRYIKQLEYHFQWPLKRINASSAIRPVPESESIPKTTEHVETIRSRELSASALQSYLSCPAKFFYGFVEGLKAPDEVSESLDAGMLGNVFHHVMQRLYKDRKQVLKADITAMKKDTALIRKLIREEILSQMHSFEVTGRNLVLENILQGYVEETLARDLALLEEAGSEAFTIIGLEQKVRGEIDGFHFKGFVDRMDSYKPGEVRIVDYKTGRVSEEELLIDEENAQKVVEKLFDPDAVSRPKIALQLFLYDYMAAPLAPAGSRLVNAIYSTARLFSEPLPDAPVCDKFSELVLEGVQNLLKELVNPEVPFRRTENTKTCEYCDFKNICGR
ncbi:MAG: PD-(D/E)XK nuclease family protein [Bacteroidales bacterium]|nr:PD-(D/E)XK nuclease family protein [Bacteroidales bacterium]